MGLDAYVSCRCWQDGKTTPPPYEVAWSEDEQRPCVVERDDWTWEEEMDVVDACDEWMETACAHRGVAADEWVSNWAGVAWFGDYLARHDYLAPTLLFEWRKREGNFGYVPADLSPLVLTELDNLLLFAVSVEADVKDREWLDDMIVKLRRLFLASVETGNPVAWC